MSRGSEFVVEYDDFGGGYYVGSKIIKQPKDTFVGDNMMVNELDGTLSPAPPFVFAPGYTVPSTSPVTGSIVVEQTGARTIYWAAGSVFFRLDNLTGPPTTYAITGTAVPRRMAYYNGLIFVPLTTAFLSYLNNGSNVVTNCAVPTALNNLVTWGEFLVGSGSASTPGRLYFSAPANATSWSANDYIDIGSPWSPIYTLIRVGAEMYVGKPEGWFAVSGVLGQTATVRQVSNEGPNTLNAGAATPPEGGVVFAGRDGRTSLLTLRGTVVSAAAFEREPWWTFSGLGDAPTPWKVYNAGNHIALAQYGDTRMYLRTPTNRWRKLSVASYLSGGWAAVSDPSPGNAGYLYAFIDNMGAGNIVSLNLAGSIDAPVTFDGAAFMQASAKLAEYRREARFRIKEVVADIDLGTSTLNAERSISVGVATPSMAVEGATAATTFSAAASTTQTYRLPASASTASERVTVRFQPTDGADTYAMRPEVTLRGVKLRRLLVHCMDIGERG